MDVNLCLFKFAALFIFSGCCHSFELMTVSTTAIYRLKIDEDLHPIVPEMIEIDSVLHATDVYYLGNLSFITIQDTFLFSASPNTSLAIFNFGNPDKVFVDHIYQNVYFVDNFLKIIGATPFHSWSAKEKSKFKLITFLVGTVTDVSIDPKKGYIFWIEHRSQFMIMRSDSIGRNVSTLIFEGLQQPSALETSIQEHSIYWYDILKQTIEKAGYNGNDRRVIFQSPYKILGFKPIAKDEVVFFKTDAMYLLVNSTIQQIILSNATGPLKYIDIEDKDLTKDLCTQHQCDHFCFLEDNGVACKCLDGYTLSLNGKNCFVSKTDGSRDFFIVLGGKICSTEIDVIIGKSRTFRCQEEFTNVTEIEIDTDSRKIIFVRWTELMWIISETVKEYWKESIIFQSEIPIRGLHLDTNRKRIFFSVADIIKRSNFRETVDIIHDAKDILSFSVDSSNGYIVWVTVENYYIQIATLNGENRRRVLQTLDIFLVYMNPFSKRIYWLTHGGIMSVQMDGQSIQVNRRLNYQALKLNIYQRLIVWTSSRENGTSVLCSADNDTENSISRCVDVDGEISDFFIQDSMAKNSKDFCIENNGGCEHQCVSEDKAHCFCKVGYEPRANVSSCTRVDEKMPFYVVESTTNTILGASDIYSKVEIITQERDQINDIDIDQYNGNLFTGHAGYIKHFTSMNTRPTWKKYILQGNASNICYLRSYAVFFISQTTQGFSLYRLSLQNGTHAIVYTGKEDSLDILCVDSINSVLIAENSKQPVTKVFHLKNETVKTIPAQFQSGYLRMKFHKDDNEFYCLEISSSKFHRIHFDWKSYAILAEEKSVIFQDFDLDEKFLYALGKYDRLLYRISKTNGVLHSKTRLSPFIGKISFLLIQYDPSKYQAPSVDSNDSRQNWIPIVIGTLSTLIVVATISFIGYRNRRRLRAFGDRIFTFVRGKPEFYMENFSRVDSLRHPPNRT